MIQLADQSIRVITFRDLRNHVRIEVAVGAFADAVRDMNVKRKGLHVDRHVPNIRSKTATYNSRLTTTAADFVLEVHEFTIQPFSESRLSESKQLRHPVPKMIRSMTFCRTEETGTQVVISVTEPPMIDGHGQIASGTKQKRPWVKLLFFSTSLK